MDRKSKIIRSAGKSFAAYEMKHRFDFDKWEDDPEIRKDSPDIVIKAADMKKADCISGREMQKRMHASYTVDLCGTWQLSSPCVYAEDGSKRFDAICRIPANVPGSVHTACAACGILKDPYVGLNDAEAMAFSSREWTYERTFIYEGSGEAVRLSFEGVCDRCDIYLNGILLGSHQGMFGGPYFDITDIVRTGENTISVQLKPAIHFTQTVVFNCSDGWHYARLWPLGIWNKVFIEDLPEAYLGSPFISTYDSVQGTMDLSMPVYIRKGRPEDYVARVVAAPKNFEGSAYFFECPVKDRMYVRFDMPEIRLWQPNGRGLQNLYTLNVYISEKSTGRDVCVKTTSFGIRSLEMTPYPSGENETVYNRTVNINREGIFLKGAGWCTIDAMMRFDRKSYDRILSRAKQQGLNFLRAWGGGLAETDDFYDLCDEYGICVYQEWPCCWDSQKTQPDEALYECVRLNTVRIRNHPSLILYGGGNEGHGVLEDETLNTMGRLTYEYDGTRTYFRQDGGPGGAGISHDHIHWSGEKPEHYMMCYAFMNEVNMHEYGLDSFMNMNSVRKYASLGEMLEWPCSARGTVSYHTATFNGTYGWTPTPHGFDMDTFMHYASMFLKVDNIAKLSIGSQMAQAMAVVPTIVNARIKWPACSCNVYYKLNDIYPGASWSVVDWYGSPKLAHYMCQDAQMPLMAVGLMDRYNTYDKPEKDLNVPVYILDDNKLLSGKHWRAGVYLYGPDLHVLAEKEYCGEGFVGKSGMVGIFHVDAQLLEKGPQFILFDLKVEGKQAGVYYMPMNFDNDTGCLFRLPEAKLETEKVYANTPEGAAVIAEYEEKSFRMPYECMYSRCGTGDNALIVRNISDVPAVGVHFICNEKESEFVCSDNYFWLMPGESRLVYVNNTECVTGVGCINYEGIKNELSLAHCQREIKDALCLEGISENCSSVTLNWQNTHEANTDIAAYCVYVDGEQKYTVPARSECEDACRSMSYTVCGLDESRTYTFGIGIIDRQCRLYKTAADVKVTVQADTETPRLLHAYVSGKNTVRLLFTKNMDSDSASDIANYSMENATVVSASTVHDAPSCVILSVNFDAHEGGARERKLHIHGLRDNSKHGNYIEDTKCSIFECITEKDFTETNGILHTRTAFGIYESAAICFKVRTNPGNNGYRVILAKCPKYDANHFELYLRPDGELYMYSVKGDVDLGINPDKDGGFADVALYFRGDTAIVYGGGKKIREMNGITVRGFAVGDMTIGALNDGTLPFDGEIMDVALYSACPENI